MKYCTSVGVLKMQTHSPYVSHSLVSEITPGQIPRLYSGWHTKSKTFYWDSFMTGILRLQWVYLSLQYKRSAADNHNSDCVTWSAQALIFFLISNTAVIIPFRIWRKTQISLHLPALLWPTLSRSSCSLLDFSDTKLSTKLISFDCFSCSFFFCSIY